MLTMQAALDRTNRLYGNNPAIVDKEGTFTWLEHMNRATRAANVLRALGLKRGERFGVICHNVFRQAELFHAGYWIGVIPVPINYRLAPAEMQFILDDADCHVVIVEDAFLDLFKDDVFSRWNNPAHNNAMCLAAKEVDTEYPQYETELAKAVPAEPVESNEDDDAILLYTGGTTGRSKGVRLSHRNIYTNGMQCTIAQRVLSDDVYLHVAPMFHSADLQATCFTLMGACHCYLPIFTGKTLLGAIEEFKITQVMAPPTMIIMTLSNEDVSQYDLGSLRLLFYGSSPMDVEWIMKTMEAFPNSEIQQGYGLTETSPILVAMDREDHRRALQSGNTSILRAAGRPVVGVQLRIMDDDGEEVPMGETGEVVVKAPNVTKGYLNRPEENERAFRNGWFHTGDVGRVDENGYLYIMDRKKDMVVTGGENVYTSEVEAALYKHAGVHETAVIGVPDEKYGEALFAVIVPTDGAQLSEEEVIAHCRNFIGGYKIPRRIAFVSELPKSAMGKILKNELRCIYSEKQSNT